MSQKECNEAEELNQYLDSINAGRHPSVEDEELKQLTDLAVFINQSYNQEELPRVLIDEVVDNIAAELQAKKQKRRTHWLYSGFLGTAAAVVIAAFVQFVLPQSVDQNIAQQMDGSIEAPKVVANAKQSEETKSTKPMDTVVTRQAPSKEKTEAPPVVVPVEEKATTSASKALAEIVNVAQSPEIEQKSVALLQEETPKDITMRKNVSMAKAFTNSEQEERTIQPERKSTKIMAMPNQTATSTTIDNTTGIIKQVYSLGNHDEIIITQKLQDESNVKSRQVSKQEKEQRGVKSTVIEPLAKNAKETEKTKETMNRLTTKVDKYDITIEGAKTSEDLKNITESLVEKEMEQ
ncbi:hypothetical protein [Pelosinus sp. UFO1]|uniref:hypothetical protein n=1 Tax=Pelosinus sp. UFO1 TaxID=484770 RepID=UPI0004D19116|nr:hypothetical protein [Pelosinus sp. UFO1]AIF52790.1 hypothetical protein UFO1_3247 [Pelosinus sp. UFO1]